MTSTTRRAVIIALLLAAAATALYATRLVLVDLIGQRQPKTPLLDTAHTEGETAP